MYFTKASYYQFRNLNSLEIKFSKKVNIFLGKNGQGKTNLLEGLYLLTQGQSFRYGDNSNLIQKNKNESVLRAQVVDGDLEFEIAAQILKSRKNFLLNKKKTTSTEIQKKFSSVIFSPESLASIKEGADLRRQLIDELLTSADQKNIQLIADFRKCLKIRNKILKNGLDGLTPENETKALLESINPLFFRLGAELSVERVRALRAVLPEINNSMQYISRTQNVDISVEYVISGENSMSFTPEMIANSIKKRGYELENAERGAGTSLVGPQKHDVIFLYNQNNSRFFCSQGQQRALILSFKMAQIVYHSKVHGTYPVLMLDDVLSELDQDKREALISFLHGINTQIFITTTDVHLSDSMKDEMRDELPAVFIVQDGNVEG
ncbi:MAG: DNA replication and repair protein RecF [Oligoflexia bacterium]|nr:MAG: DNA replication and repair protein RecF [Oligoflexia bacterium]